MCLLPLHIDIRQRPLIDQEQSEHYLKDDIHRLVGRYSIRQCQREGPAGSE
jgi:hypothetical protein